MCGVTKNVNSHSRFVAAPTQMTQLVSGVELAAAGRAIRGMQMTRRRTQAQLSIVVAAVVLAAASVSAQTVGYTARASGFDLNFDGIVGEAGSADLNVCDGQGDLSSTTGE